MSGAVRPLLGMGVALTLVAASTQPHAPRLVWNLSASAPPGLYRIGAREGLAVGDLVATRLPAPLATWMASRGYLAAGAPLLKRVAAGPGSTICRNGARLSIDGRGVAAAQTRDRSGRPLPAWHGCRVLRSDQLFLLNAEVSDSFDGRYLGPLDADLVIGRAHPLWTRGG
ncbi:S26 family signal peptidase [Rhodovulum marinum]|uniref:Conjugation peptidase TraF n=1 Tax=Rhodovulum marinum TaxID=320662 RepID=A0A4R2PUG4_9RHOB|nr:S26 family signal peptidase [Rhodovulum marinum]TCP39600.1 conjugation peptidase TraF [Rhodovulum marinum]